MGKSYVSCFFDSQCISSFATLFTINEQCNPAKLSYGTVYEEQIIRQIKMQSRKLLYCTLTDAEHLSAF